MRGYDCHFALFLLRVCQLSSLWHRSINIPSQICVPQVQAVFVPRFFVCFSAILHCLRRCHRDLAWQLGRLREVSRKLFNCRVQSTEEICNKSWSLPWPEGMPSTASHTLICTQKKTDYKSLLIFRALVLENQLNASLW